MSNWYRLWIGIFVLVFFLKLPPPCPILSEPFKTYNRLFQDIVFPSPESVWFMCQNSVFHFYWAIMCNFKVQTRNTEQLKLIFRVFVFYLGTFSSWLVTKIDFFCVNYSWMWLFGNTAFQVIPCPNLRMINAFTVQRKCIGCFCWC